MLILEPSHNAVRSIHWSSIRKSTITWCILNIFVVFSPSVPFWEICWRNHPFIHHLVTEHPQCAGVGLGVGSDGREQRLSCRLSTTASFTTKSVTTLVLNSGQQLNAGIPIWWNILQSLKMIEYSFNCMEIYSSIILSEKVGSSIYLCSSICTFKC